jgi:predicted anti-sigma-YlaC factor YlaD
MALNLHSCGTAVRRISEMQDARLARSARVGLWIHLAICSHCRRYARQVRRLRGLFAGYPDHLSHTRLPDDTRSKIVNRLKKESSDMNQ